MTHEETGTQTPLTFEQFWQYSEPLDSSLVVIAPPPDNRTILDVLGTISLASADASVMQYLDGVYNFQFIACKNVHFSRLSIKTK